MAVGVLHTDQETCSEIPIEPWSSLDSLGKSLCPCSGVEGCPCFLSELGFILLHLRSLGDTQNMKMMSKSATVFTMPIYKGWLMHAFLPLYCLYDESIPIQHLKWGFCWVTKVPEVKAFPVSILKHICCKKSMCNILQSAHIMGRSDSIKHSAEWGFWRASGGTDYMGAITSSFFLAINVCCWKRRSSNTMSWRGMAFRWSRSV